ncbi:MAG: ATP-dependent Clp protease proteolytic subunit [Candidatus Pacebacteria bacterium]|nr:ATP-dependent Clp protease proteolytic subunit [Candidatus Paceibacterota bacterium]
MEDNAYLIFIDKVPKIGINTLSLKDVEEKIAENKAKNLFLIIESYGGSPFDAIAIMNILHLRFPKISTIIPCFAKSAATLMSLGTDEIYMQEKSALGPLDLPIEHHKDGSTISSLDIQNTITSMAGLVGSIAEDRFKLFTENTTISKKEAMKLSLDNATDFVKPIIQQVDPYHLQKAERELRIGSWYAMDMLLKRMMKGQYIKARKTANTLVKSFPAHEYSIFPEVAENMLGLKIKKISDLQLWESNLKKIYNNVCKKQYHIEYGIIKKNVIKNTKQKK